MRPRAAAASLRGRFARVVIMAVLTTQAVACGAGPRDLDGSLASRVEGWEGINNLSREGPHWFGGQPDSVSIYRLAAEGVTTFISIRDPRELAGLAFDEPAVVAAAGMRYVNIPVTPATLSPDDVDRLAEVLEEAEGDRFIHCGSSNRVGGLWAAYLALERGIDVETALERGRAAGLRSSSMVEAVRRVVNPRP